MGDFDFGNAEAWEVSNLLPVGNHVVLVDDAKSDNGPNHPEIQLWLSNPSGQIRDWVSITAKTQGKVVQLFDAAGVQRPQQGEFDSQTGKLTQACVDRLKGKKVGIVVREKEDPRDRSKTLKEVAGYLAQSQITGGAAVQSAAAPAASGSRSDVIPF